MLCLFANFALPVKRGQHGSEVCGYFMSTAGGDTAGVVSVLACWAWAAGTEV